MNYKEYCNLDTITQKSDYLARLKFKELEVLYEIKESLKNLYNHTNDLASVQTELPETKTLEKKGTGGKRTSSVKKVKSGSGRNTRK